jgi:hypothetical protein
MQICLRSTSNRACCSIQIERLSIPRPAVIIVWPVRLGSAKLRTSSPWKSRDPQLRTTVTIMTDHKLTDTQLALLSGAAQHPDSAITLPTRLRGGAVQKVVSPLLAKGLVEEVEHRSDLPAWRTDKAGARWSLLITRAGLQATGIEVEPEPAAAKAQRSTRIGTKQEHLIAMLRRPKGATIDEITATTGWQAHTVRGAISGALKKKLGLEVASEKVEGRGRVYRVG